MSDKFMRQMQDYTYKKKAIKENHRQASPLGGINTVAQVNYFTKRDEDHTKNLVSSNNGKNIYNNGTFVPHL